MSESCALACPLCQQSKTGSQLVSGELIRDGITRVIHRHHPEWTAEAMICRDCLKNYRGTYVEETLKQEKGELSAIERQVVKSLKEQELVAQNINSTFERQLTLGERTADQVASFGGSWKFIFTFGCILVVWIFINGVLFAGKAFDPFPFILLNLILSCLAAIQAPFIMMSQNRQEAKDRLRSEYDYRVNLKAELEIRHLNEKIDHLLQKQWQRLLEIQQIQLDLMEEQAGRKRASKAAHAGTADPAPSASGETVPAAA